jgi:2'-5' RNA ligase
MRLFVAIDFPRDVSESVACVRARFEPASGPDLRWSAPEGWHVTLQFLGSVSDERCACVLQHLKTIQAAPVPIPIDGLGFFERAGVFWAGIGLTPELLALQQFITAATRHCGFVPEDRPYSPHITLARAKGHSGARALTPVKKALEKSSQKEKTVSADFTAQEFLLYESMPGPEGSRYEIRARFPLTGRRNL